MKKAKLSIFKSIVLTLIYLKIGTSPIFLNASSLSECEINALPEGLKSQMIEKGTWKPGCPIPMDRLRLITFKHYDFSGRQQQGELVVLEAVATRVTNIFDTLYRYRFPIAQAKTIEHYGGVDQLSMASNNTSAFNYRPIAGKTLLSVHSYGVAIDLNPIQNPCIEPQMISSPEEVRVLVQPAEGQAYLNRTNIRPGMVEEALDITGLRVVELFKQNGFHVWGGSWNDPVDWQHFQPSRAAAEWLAFMEPQDAILLFELYAMHPTFLNDPKAREYDFKSLYEGNRLQFMQAIQTLSFWNMSPKEAYDSLQCSLFNK